MVFVTRGSCYWHQVCISTTMSIKHPLKIPKRCTAGHLLSSYDVFCVSASFMAIYSLKLTFVATFLFITYNNNYPFMALDPGQCRQVSITNRLANFGYLTAPGWLLGLFHSHLTAATETTVMECPTVRLYIGCPSCRNPSNLPAHSMLHCTLWVLVFLIT